MTVGELKSHIEDLDDNIEVQLVLVQSRSNLIYRLGVIGLVDDRKVGTETLYLGTGYQIGYSTREIDDSLQG